MRAWPSPLSVLSGLLLLAAPAPSAQQAPAPPGPGPTAAAQPLQRPTPVPQLNFPRLGFSFNKASGVSGTQWNVLTQYADLALGLDGHGYEFPGILDDFRAARPDVPAFCFVTSMAIVRGGLSDWRFKYLDRDETAFLHCADPASLKVVILEGATRLFWVRDLRNVPGSLYPDPIGVTRYVVESAPTHDGPWTQAGQPIPEDGTTYYEATVPSVDPARWYRVRSELTDTSQLADYSWPTQPDPAPRGFAYLKVLSDLHFVAGLWGAGPANAGDVVLEWGKHGSWGHANPALTQGLPSNGITEYTGIVTSYPTSGAWVLRLHSTSQGVLGMQLDPSRRNNRVVDRYGAHLFKPDHPRALHMHSQRLLQAQALGIHGAHLDFVLDSYPTWLVATPPAGEDAAYVDIEPHMISMLGWLKATFPQTELILNGLSVTSTVAGILDYLPYADGADCEYLGWSSPSATQPFRDLEMLDGVIWVAHGLGKKVTCYSYAAADNHEARITSIARYWLVASPDVYYHYQTADYHQTVDYFPEYDINMGPPDRPVLSSRNDLVSGSVYIRRYLYGVAYYNPGSTPVWVSFGAPDYIVTLQGAQSPKQGGTGSVQFVGPVVGMTLAPKRGALVVKYPRLAR